MRADHVRAVRRRRRMDTMWANAIWGVMAIVIVCSISLMMVFVVQDRIRKYPQLGTDIIPKTERQRQLEAEPKRYVGR